MNFKNGVSTAELIRNQNERKKRKLIINCYYYITAFFALVTVLITYVIFDIGNLQ